MPFPSILIHRRDVLNVLGMYPGDPGPPGGDVAAAIAAVAAGSGHRVGELVFGQAAGCLGTAVLSNHHTGEEASQSLPLVGRHMCLSAGCCSEHRFSSYRILLLVCPPAVVPVPPHVAPDAACTLPTVFLTADACLSAAAAVQPGQTVLIHAATGQAGR